MNSKAAIQVLKQGLPLVGVALSDTLTLRTGAADPSIVSAPVTIRNCELDNLDAGFVLFQAPVTLENVTLHGDCLFHGCFFPAGFSAVHCRFQKGIDFRWGGHNKKGCLFRLEHCEFGEFADFEDDWFEGPIEIRNCTFRKGSNLLGLRGHPLKVTFDVDPVIESNSGSLDLDTAPAAG